MSIAATLLCPHAEWMGNSQSQDFDNIYATNKITTPHRTSTSHRAVARRRRDSIKREEIRREEIRRHALEQAPPSPQVCDWSEARRRYSVFLPPDHNARMVMAERYSEERKRRYSLVDTDVQAMIQQRMRAGKHSPAEKHRAEGRELSISHHDMQQYLRERERERDLRAAQSGQAGVELRTHLTQYRMEAVVPEREREKERERERRGDGTGAGVSSDGLSDGFSDLLSVESSGPKTLEDVD
ncbi:hypothetical protein KIPB_007845 [Kipferlia bialata]|uniref:Uncharacterized protein n=1 Tax=Kipferlia bialata TaxID=797122 RepID=A0A9K3D1X2_9EUKA|nr:hypothetical protein KIPB_007845 [Kipferlia bialata]|eukprot:g7845.t1